MTKYSTEFKMRVVKEYLEGYVSLKNLAENIKFSSGSSKTMGK